MSQRHAARTSICDECGHAKTPHPKKPGGRCRDTNYRTSAMERCDCTKTQQEVFDASEAKRAEYRARQAAINQRKLAYRARANALYYNLQGVSVDGDSRVRVEERPGGAWVSAQVWVPETEIEIEIATGEGEVQS